MTRTLAVLAISLPLILAGCSHDDGYNYSSSGEGAVAVVVDAPLGLVESTYATGDAVAADHTPVPGNGNFGDYWGYRANSIYRSTTHAGYTTKYLLLNANSDLPPYDPWWPDQFQRDWTTIHKTFDAFLIGFDWDDPYVDSGHAW